ncbi:hypothetical protein EPUL_006584 [Erysiphe pulchra]|uniref:Uncharacterized protein n=1 Tax=Erysiphe pulchra TaxID=225359 RepID=A0A2S4PJS6_9PEZI|nr:hypothetical protein EPUL_006584 [Erysiphe pulchra]
MNPEETNTPQYPPSKKQQRKIDKNNEQVQKRLDNIKAQKEKLNKQFEKLDATQDDIEKRLAEGKQGEDISAQDDDSDILSIPSNDELQWPTEDIIKVSNLDGLAITTTPPKNEIHVQSRNEQLAQLSSNDYKLNFDNVIKEVNSWDFKVIQIDSVKLSQTLTKFIEVGSIIHKLTPDELTIVANHKGKYTNKEEQLVEKVDNSIIPKTIAGLMANGTKFLDAVIYLSMELSRRPNPSPTDMEPDDEGNIDLPTYDDLVKLTTYMFVVFFYILIRAHSPSDTGDYKGQPMPKFITTILGVHDAIGDIVDYLASFDLQKIDPSWVQNVPAKNISQEAINRFGLGVAGYRLVSVFNIVKPDLYAESQIGSNQKD